MKYEIKVILEVSDNWIEDGFDMKETERIDQLKNAFEEMLPYAYSYEVKTKITVKEKV